MNTTRIVLYLLLPRPADRVKTVTIQKFYRFAESIELMNLPIGAFSGSPASVMQRETDAVHKE